jgi:hypothetical protein
MLKLKFIFLFIFILYLPQLKSSNLYPEWFLYPGKYPNLHVGYSYNGAPEIIDAERMYCALNECIVLGALEIYQIDYNDDYLKQSNYFYYFSPDSLDSLKNRLKPADRFCINILTDDYVSAFTLDKKVTVKNPRISVDDIPRPEWITQNFWDDEGYYYGVGIYTSLGSEADAWKTSEERAIFSILTNIAVQYHKLKIFDDTEELQQNMEQISFLKIKYLLRNIEFIERFPHREEKVFYVLVRIPKRDVISPFLK